MKVPYRSQLGAFALAAASVVANAQTLPPPTATSGEWNGLDVTLLSPSYKVWQFDPFQLSLVIDSSGGTDMASFTTTLLFSDTVTFNAQTTWTYELLSDDPSYRYTDSGRVGDSPFAELGDGNTLTLRDPFWYPYWGTAYSHLSPEYHDKLIWTFDNIFIDGNTDVTVLLSDDQITGELPFRAAALVEDPPRPAAGTPVPEPGSLALALAGLGMIGLGRISRARGKAD